jgi:pimeloyl-ACP methyl ester carboxylesterase
MAMIVELVRTQTRDGVRLDGIFQAPRGADIDYPLDGVCFVHGTGGNFYSSTLFDVLGEHFLARGCGVLRVNTRGHDGISTAATPQGGRRQGAAYEFVDDCRHDLAAWCDWLGHRAGPRIGLVGHSLGAVKCLYALTSPAPPSATCLIALSPPRLSYSWFCASAQGSAFLEDYRRAEQLVQAGQPAALLDVKLPLPMFITAAGYAEKYGPDERYNYLRFVGGVPCPTLVTLGAIEAANNMAFQGAYEAVQERAARQPRLRAALVAGADHFYTGVHAPLLAAIESWRQATLASA